MSKTLKDFFGDAVEGDGRKFTNTHFKSSEWFRPYFKSNKGYWYGTTDSGSPMSWPDTRGDWSEWQEPKKKITRWLWAVREDELWPCFGFYTEEEAHQHHGHYPIIKLEWSATEFEE